MSGKSAEGDAALGRGAMLSGVVTSFNVLVGAGLVLALAILLTTISTRTILRPSTFYVLLISIMCYLLFFLILAFGGAQLAIQRPEEGICLFQGVLLQFAPVWLSFATAAYAFQMWQATRGFLGRLMRHQRLYKFWLVAAPVTFGALVLLISLGTAITPDNGKSMRFKVKLTRDNYGIVCWITSTTTLTVTYIFAGIGVILAITFTFLLVRILIRKGWLHEIDLDQNQGKICRSTLTRLVLFITFLIILLGLSFPDSWSKSIEGKRRKGSEKPIPLDGFGASKRVLLAVFPLLMVLVISLQLDVLQIWAFWRRNKKPQEREIQIGRDSSTIGTSIYTGTSTRFMSLTPARAHY